MWPCKSLLIILHENHSLLSWRISLCASCRTILSDSTSETPVLGLASTQLREGRVDIFPPGSLFRAQATHSHTVHDKQAPKCRQSAVPRAVTCPCTPVSSARPVGLSGCDSHLLICCSLTEPLPPAALMTNSPGLLGLCGRCFSCCLTNSPAGSTPGTFVPQLLRQSLRCQGTALISTLDSLPCPLLALEGEG